MADKELPDIAEIEELLTIVEGRDAANTSIEAFDRDYQALTNVQSEVMSLVGQTLPAKVTSDVRYQQEPLRRLLNRIDDALTANRAKADSAAG